MNFFILNKLPHETELTSEFMNKILSIWDSHACFCYDNWENNEWEISVKVLIKCTFCQLRISDLIKFKLFLTFMIIENSSPYKFFTRIVTDCQTLMDFLSSSRIYRHIITTEFGKRNIRDRTMINMVKVSVSSK
jgi:hypothetical protein